MSTEVADSTNLSEKKDFLVRSSSLKDVSKSVLKVIMMAKLEQILNLE